VPKNKIPSLRSVWKHHSGRIYEVDDIRNEHSTNDEYPITVCYVGANGYKWSKSITRWHETMTWLSDA